MMRPGPKAAPRPDPQSEGPRPTPEDESRTTAAIPRIIYMQRCVLYK